jgi:hypothetical protein
VCFSDQACQRPLSCVGEDPPTNLAGECTDTSTVGAPCDGDCNGPGLYCNAPNGTTSGTCVALHDDGQACNSNNECAYTLHCVGNICQSRAPEGGTCIDRRDCADLLFCSNEIDNTPTGTCTAPQPSGSGCTGDSQCVSYICAASGAGGTRVCEDYQTCQ